MKITQVTASHSIKVQGNPSIDGDFSSRTAWCTLTADIEPDENASDCYGQMQKECERLARGSLGLSHWPRPPRADQNPALSIAPTTASATIDPPPGGLAAAVGLETLKATAKKYTDDHGGPAMKALLVKLFKEPTTWDQVAADPLKQRMLATELGIAG